MDEYKKAAASPNGGYGVHAGAMGLVAHGRNGCAGLHLSGLRTDAWEYANSRFNSINGSASSLAETRFSNESMIRVSPLPLASDIDVRKIVEFFNKG